MTEPLAVVVRNDTLHLGPVNVHFRRTVRIPEKGLHHLPPSLGSFPLRRVQDYPDTVPADWLARGGVMLPIRQREAMWLDLGGAEPAALQVALGKVCAVSGAIWSATLTANPQNYVSLPRQPWLDGINSGEGSVRQFVATRLGLGATVEGQVTGEETVGGFQLRAVGLTAQALEVWKAQEVASPQIRGAAGVHAMAGAPLGMGVGAGGTMRQEIYRDSRPLDDYDAERSSRVFVHLCSAEQWTAITGEAPPPSPIDRETYVHLNLPWFDYFDDDGEDLAPSDTLATVKTVGDVLELDEPAFTPTKPATVVVLKDQGGDAVAPGEW
ncbi:hypothetical protein C8046_13360 [Serinibacter arcticus]|uniref:Integral membrane protein n=1 Tax=Serinibacter arcticus TaxID=1655435 RepID=A0A2U1ZWX5_9MICO|nr:hypothetical protein [Serinibacter arcticus]PWD51497.1 hypothetical protein C8046_13360 [Serinibacter arcticus]